MFERILLTTIICAVALGLFFLFSRTQRLQLNAVPTSGNLQTTGQSAILYFRSDSCVSCKTQARFVQDVAESAEITIQTIDVEKQPEKAAQYKIMTLPTTVILDQTGTVKHINYGLTHATKLARQVEKYT